MSKNDKQGIVLLIVLAGLIAIFVYWGINSYIYSQKSYEFAKDGEIFQSNECYQTEDGDCFCKYENNYVQVDNYYEEG